MPVLKVIELVGISAEGWGAAARTAVAEAARTIRHIQGLEVLKSSAVVRDGEIVEYRVQVKLTFLVEDHAEPQVAVEAAEAILAEPTVVGGEPATGDRDTLLEEIEELGNGEREP